MKPSCILLVVALPISACTTDLEQPEQAANVEPFEAISMLGDTLRAPVPPADQLLAMEARLDTARINYEADTTLADALIWLGRRTAYLGRYNEAIEIYTSGIEKFPGDARFLRHRGHRMISVRRFDDAIEDLSRAAALVAGEPDEVEPDGLPNARNIPTSTLQSNIWYHLGLAHYLSGEFSTALDAYLEEAAITSNPDMLVATSWWRYLTLRRLGRDGDASEVLATISPDLDIIENFSYHRLLLMAKGDLQAEELLAPAEAGGDPAGAAVSYGVAIWSQLEGNQPRADSLYRDLVERGPWAAFGAIAAEAELARDGG